jgi:hypothetical protein
MAERMGGLDIMALSPAYARGSEQSRDSEGAVSDLGRY